MCLPAQSLRTQFNVPFTFASRGHFLSSQLKSTETPPSSPPLPKTSPSSLGWSLRLKLHLHHWANVQLPGPVSFNLGGRGVREQEGREGWGDPGVLVIQQPLGHILHAARGHCRPPALNFKMGVGERHWASRQVVATSIPLLMAFPQPSQPLLLWPLYCLWPE